MLNSATLYAFFKNDYCYWNRSAVLHFASNASLFYTINVWMVIAFYWQCQLEKKSCSKKGSSVHSPKDAHFLLFWDLVCFQSFFPFPFCPQPSPLPFLYYIGSVCTLFFCSINGASSSLIISSWICQFVCEHCHQVSYPFGPVKVIHVHVYNLHLLVHSLFVFYWETFYYYQLLLLLYNVVINQYMMIDGTVEK